MHATTRLAHLLELADKGPALRAALAEELASLLTDWPGDCPVEMRGACEALLARAAREVDSDVRARLRQRFHAYPDLAARVLPPEEPREENIGRSLIEAAREGVDLSAVLARALNLSRGRAEEILCDPSGHAVAIACKNLQIPRAVYSTLTMLLGGKDDVTDCYARLDLYDAMSVAYAAEQLQGWRTGDMTQHAA
jgi:hypothetical protein